MFTEGIYNINKPAGWTSFDVVAKIRNLSKIKKVGHAGTLDPLATGVLVVCLGRVFTRNISIISKTEKEYIATVQLGYTTASYDSEKPLENKNAKLLTENEIREALMSFVGEQEQLPPLYSAVMVGGKRLYKYARDNEVVEIKPRAINIKNITLLEITSGDPAGAFSQVKFSVVCSAGTYLRTLAHDLGQKLGCGGYLLNLVRTRVGDYRLADSFDFKNAIEQLKMQEAL
jgi:tRNA pseudouridine55 synthase